MPKSASTDAYALFLDTLIGARKRVGMTQTDLGLRIGKNQSFVSAFERGSRRLDVVEFHVIAKALKLDPVELFAEVSKRLPDNTEM